MIFLILSRLGNTNVFVSLSNSQSNETLFFSKFLFTSYFRDQEGRIRWVNNKTEESLSPADLREQRCVYNCVGRRRGGAGGGDVGSREKTYCSFFSRIMELTCQPELCLSCWKNALCFHLACIHPLHFLSSSISLYHAPFPFFRSPDADEEINARTILSFRPTDKKDLLFQDFYIPCVSFLNRFDWKKKQTYLSIFLSLPLSM